MWPKSYFFIFLFYTVTLEQQSFFVHLFVIFRIPDAHKGAVSLKKMSIDFFSFELCNSTCNSTVLLNPYINYHIIYFFKTFEMCQFHKKDHIQFVHLQYTFYGYISYVKNYDMRIKQDWRLVFPIQIHLIIITETTISL